jgi:hypothetical protein
MSAGRNKGEVIAIDFGYRGGIRQSFRGAAMKTSASAHVSGRASS